MRLLMHMCCANCSLYPIQSMSRKGLELKGLWFNPNIQPSPEYGRRLDALQRLEGLWGLDIEYLEAQGAGGFPLPKDNSEGRRCLACYTARLDTTAQTAKKMGMEGFTTSLLVSPYQRFELIVRAAEEAGKRHSVLFYYEDFRPGWREGVRISRDLGLYRQNYCGCLHSKAERELDKQARREAKAGRGA